jgi:hypothetical protein
VSSERLAIPRPQFALLPQADLSIVSEQVGYGKLRKLSTRRHPRPMSSMVAEFATMLLSSRLGQHVGEAAANTDTAVVGEGAAQGRATRTGHCTGLTD